MTTHPVRPHLPGEVLVGQQWRETWPKYFSTACSSNPGTPAYVREAAVRDFVGYCAAGGQDSTVNGDFLRASLPPVYFDYNYLEAQATTIIIMPVDIYSVLGINK